MPALEESRGGFVAVRDDDRDNAGNSARSGGTNSNQGSDFGSIDMLSEKKRSGSKRHQPYHNSRESIIESVKKFASRSPPCAVTSSMHYATPRLSYLQKTFHVVKSTKLQKNLHSDVIKNDPDRGGLRGTFTEHRSNYLQQQVQKHRMTHM